MKGQGMELCPNQSHITEGHGTVLCPFKLFGEKKAQQFE